MATVTSGPLAKITKEELAPNIRESLWDIDGAFRVMNETSFGVERDGLGRNWQFIQTWETGLSGGFRVRGAGGANVVSGLNNVNIFGAAQAFPSAQETTATSFLQKTITLKEGYGSFAVPHQYLRADRLTAAIGSGVRSLMKGTAKKIAHLVATDFYTNDSTNFTLCGVGTVSSTVTNNGTAAVTVDLDGTAAAGQIGRFFPGLLVDIYDSTATTKRNSNFLVVVDEVDPLGNAFILRSVDGASLLTLSNNDIIVKEASLGQGFSGLETWIKNSGTVFGISLTTYPHFKSYLPSSVSAALTETLLNKYVGKFMHAYNHQHKIDTIITTTGVTLGYLAAYDSFVKFERQGEELRLNGGFAEVGYAYNGSAVKWLISTYCAAGTLYAIKTGEGNLKRYVPPMVPGTGSDELFDSSVEFTGPLGGSNGIFVHGRQPGSSAITDNVEAPFVKLMEHCPDQVQSVKLTGITETLGT